MRNAILSVAISKNAGTLLVLLSFWSAPCIAQHYQSVTVIRIHDGDTVTAETVTGRRLQIRIAGIDAPELKQAHGVESQQALVKFLGDRQPNLDCLKTDKYRRRVCRVTSGDGFDVALEMVASGGARWYQKYAADQTAEERAAFSQAEDQAKRQNLGLWATANVAPWDWRAAHRSR